MVEREERRHARRLPLGFVAASVALLAPASAVAALPGQTYQFEIAAGPLDAALAAYARVTRRQLLYTSALVAGRRSPALWGTLTADEALARLLAGSGIVVRPAGKAFVLMQTPRSPPVAQRAPTSRPQTRRERRRAPAPPAPRPVAEEASSEEILVTGSNIRGISEGASPVITLGRDEIDRAGQATIGEAIAALPQTFGGTATEDTSLTGADRTTPNTGLGTSANLRGLGSDATLTLVNGRRVAGSGGQGDFTDLSTIPLAAIERIEILTDGASALYGSDAVGGVVNIILRKRMRGAETRLRLGTTTQGGADEAQFGQVLGRDWTGGHILLAYEYYRRERLPSDARLYTRSADLRPFGGSDWRSYVSNPGTVLGIVGGALVPAWRIPSGQNGTGLVASDFTPGANLENFRAGIDILPRQERHSLYATLGQELGGGLSLFAEGRYARRNFRSSGQASQAILQIDARNPYFVSPTGAASDNIAYSFAREIGPIRQSGRVEAWSATAGFDWNLLRDWHLEGYFSRAREDTRTDNSNIVNSTYLAEAVGTLADDPATPFSTATSGFFNPYGDGLVNRPAVLDFVRQGFSWQETRSAISVASLKLDGGLFDLPGGTVRAALGVNSRREDFDRGGEGFFSGTRPRPVNPTDASRSIGAVFGELAIPLFGPGNARPGLRRLQLSAAVRREAYSDFGSSIDPKFGIIWEPVTGTSLRASYGTSFRAPVLREVRDPLQISFLQLRDAAGALIPTVTMFGGNPGLGPERARSFTMTARWSPAGNPNWRLEAGWFDIRFRNRIERPAADNLTQALSNAAFSPYVTRVNPGASAADRARVVALITDPGSVIPAVFPPEFFRAILDARLVNAASLHVRGFDLQAGGSFAAGKGRGSLQINASYLVDFKRQITPGAVEVERVGTIGNPPPWRLRGTAGYDAGIFGMSLSANHVAGYLDDVSRPARPVAAWTTLDAQVRLQPKILDKDGVTFAFNVQNLFDQDPPFVDQLSGVGYGAASADPLGRTLSLQIIKRW